MRPHHRTLHRPQVHRSAAHFPQDHLPLRPYKRSVTVSMLWAVLLATAAEVGSLHATCRWLDGLPCEETLRKAVYASIPDYAVLQRQLNGALAGRLPRSLRRRRQRLAIDLTPIPYHGEPFRDRAEIYRSRGKAGTSHFHAHATAYVVRRGERSTVALLAVPRGAALDGVVEALLRQARPVGVKASPVLLDRGFYAVDVIRYLHRARLPFLMPVKLTGRKPGHREGPGGTRVVTAVKRSGWLEHTAVSGARTARVAICVACRNDRGRWRRHGRQRLIYACWGVTGHSCARVRGAYRSRFGIESSYRQMNRARGRTSTRRPEPRLLYVGSSPAPRNGWVWLHWELLSTPRRGGRLLRRERLRLRTLVRGLRQVVEREYGVITETPTERGPCSLLPAG